MSNIRLRVFTCRRCPRLIKLGGYGAGATSGLQKPAVWRKVAWVRSIRATHFYQTSSEKRHEVRACAAQSLHGFILFKSLPGLRVRDAAVLEDAVQSVIQSPRKATDRADCRSLWQTICPYSRPAIRNLTPLLYLKA